MFKHSCDLPDVRPGMRCDVNPSVDSISHTFENGMLRVRAVINLECMASDRVEANIVRRIDGSDVEMKTIRFKAGHTHVETAEHSLREDARLPRPASKLLSVNGYARVQNVSMEPGLARVSGMLRLSVLFAALDGIPCQTPVSIPFEHAFPLPDDAVSAVAIAQILQLSTALMDEDIITGRRAAADQAQRVRRASYRGRLRRVLDKAAHCRHRQPHRLPPEHVERPSLHGTRFAAHPRGHARPRPRALCRGAPLHRNRDGKGRRRHARGYDSGQRGLHRPGRRAPTA